MTLLTHIDPDAHLGIPVPAELPGVELEIEPVADALDTIDHILR